MDFGESQRLTLDSDSFKQGTLLMKTRLGMFSFLSQSPESVGNRGQRFVKNVVVVVVVVVSFFIEIFLH